MNFTHKDLFFFSFNEGAKNYIVKDCNTIFNTIIECSPKIIVICTQESLAQGQTHFQHVLNTLFEKTNYKRLLKYDASERSVLSVIGSIKTENKNVRTRVYYDTKSVINNIITKSETQTMTSIMLSKSFWKPLTTQQTQNASKYINKSLQVINKENESYINQNTKLNNSTKLYITQIAASGSKESGLSQTFEKTLYKGSICIRLEMQSKNNDTYKFIFVNSHLFYKKNKNTGEDKRTEEFISLCKEFKLAKFYKLGYNILFSGDLNFRLFRSNLDTKNNKMHESLNVSKKIINIIEKQHKHSIENIQQKNELYLIIDKIIKTINEKKTENQLNELYKFIPKMNNNSKVELLDLFKKFMENFELFGIHLTCKIKEKFNNKLNNNSCDGKFNCAPPNGYARIPSMCDKILVADHENIHYTKDNFKVIKDSNPSDHFPITFTCIFLSKENIH